MSGFAGWVRARWQDFVRAIRLAPGKEYLVESRLLPLARKQWRREGIAHTERRCDFERHRMEPGYLAALFGDALGEFIS